VDTPMTKTVVDRKELARIVAETLVDQLGISLTEIRPESRIVEDLGADSLEAVELAIKLEERFEIEIDDQVAARLVTVQDVIEYLSVTLKVKGEKE